MIRGSSKLA